MLVSMVLHESQAILKPQIFFSGDQLSPQLPVSEQHSEVSMGAGQGLFSAENIP